MGEEYLTPYFTDYENIVQYQTFDVTPLLQAGENALSVMLGNGWYRGRFGFGDEVDRLFGDHMQLLAELIVGFQDGTSRTAGADGQWQCRPSPVRPHFTFYGFRFVRGSIPNIDPTSPRRPPRRYMKLTFSRQARSIFHVL